MNLTSLQATGVRKQGHGVYFFLSYAHSVPVERAVLPPGNATDSKIADVDPMISEFFNELSVAVTARVGQGSDLDIGFYDQEIPLGVDIKSRLSNALGSAEVFVPLYSPGYFAKSWPQRELEAFRERLRQVGAVADDHIVPVLWTPILDWQRYPDVERAMRVEGGSPEYVENGLRALHMLQPYRASYARILAWLASRIVDVAERHPVGPSTAPELDQVATRDVDEAGFVVAMLGSDQRPASPPPWWRSYASPIVQHAASVAERLGLRSRAMSIDEAESRFVRVPGIVLVDPWTAAEGSGLESLKATLRALPSWVLVLLLEEPVGQSARGHLLKESIGAVRDVVRGRVESVNSMVQLDRMFPAFVARARREYLKQMHVPSSSGSTSRRPPRLAEWRPEEES